MPDEKKPGLADITERTVPEVRPNFVLADLDGTPRSITEWDGKPLLINFWATWCPPCVREIPLLIELQNRHQDLQIIGIAIDELELVQEFLAKRGVVNYPMLIGQEDAIQVAADFGIDLYGLPYSVLVDRRGRISKLHIGEIKAEEAEELLSRILDAEGIPQSGANLR